jgi:hypothetical protein
LPATELAAGIADVGGVGVVDFSRGVVGEERGVAGDRMGWAGTKTPAAAAPAVAAFKVAAPFSLAAQFLSVARPPMVTAAVGGGSGPPQLREADSPFEEVAANAAGGAASAAEAESTEEKITRGAVDAERGGGRGAHLTAASGFAASPDNPGRTPTPAPSWMAGALDSSARGAETAAGEGFTASSIDRV